MPRRPIPRCIASRVRAGERRPVAASGCSSNPIYVRGPTADDRATRARPPSTDARRCSTSGKQRGGAPETDATSLAAVDVRRGTTVPELGFRFGLATGDTKHQFAALGVVDT